MKTTKILSALLLVLTISTAANAYIIPGQGPGGGPIDNGRPPGYIPPNDGDRNNSRPPQYQPPRNDNNNGWGRGDDRGHGGGNHGGGWGPRPQPQSYYPPTQPYYPPQPAPYYPPTQPYYPPNPPPAPQYPQVVAIPVYVGRSVSNERIQLSSLANLAAYSGYRILAVTARTTPNSPSTTLVRLAVDENVIATQTNPGYQVNLMPVTTYLSSYSNLELWINGSTYIESIEVQLQR
ncbi:MAG: hypothetical protein H7256_13835 [Bdellovibrio sp.]|nr:hypothetical protein [Bdellovibrio sp.]